MTTSLTAQDLELRRGRITGSTVSAVLGLHPLVKPMEAWAEILGRRSFSGNDITEMGVELEEPLARIALRRLNVAGIHAPGTLVHQQQAWWAATADVIIPSWQSGIQIKCQAPASYKYYLGRPGARGEYDNEIVPPYHLLQCLWEMGVYNARVWYLAAFFNITDYRLYKLRMDEVMLGRLQARAYDWWRQHIDPEGEQEPPDTPWRPEIGKGVEQAARAKKKTDGEWLTMETKELRSAQ